MSKDETILLADGNDDDALLVQHAFQALGLEKSLTVIQDGEEAIRYLAGQGRYADRKNYPVPLVLLFDLELPLKSGFALLEWIGERPEFRGVLTPVVLTAVTLSRSMEKAYKLGAHSYLIKPVNFGDLVKMMNRVKEYWIETNRRPKR